MSYKLEPLEVLRRQALVLMCHATGAAREDKSIDTMVATLVTVGDDGKWNACWRLAGDQKQYDAFWS